MNICLRGPDWLNWVNAELSPLIFVAAFCCCVVVAFTYVSSFHRNIHKSHDGACEHGPPVCVCPRILLPVCGINGVTYSNQCEMECRYFTVNVFVWVIVESCCVLNGKSFGVGTQQKTTNQPPPHPTTKVYIIKHTYSAASMILLLLN